MAEVKTKPTTQSVASYLNAIDDEARRKDCRALAALMKRASELCTADRLAKWDTVDGRLERAADHVTYSLSLLRGSSLSCCP